jgi:hypothetical protein
MAAGMLAPRQHQRVNHAATFRGPRVLVADQQRRGPAVTFRSRRQRGWEIVLSNTRQLARSDSATPEDAKRKAEAALPRLRS